MPLLLSQQEDLTANRPPLGTKGERGMAKKKAPKKNKAVKSTGEIQIANNAEHVLVRLKHKYGSNEAVVCGGFDSHAARQIAKWLMSHADAVDAD